MTEIKIHQRVMLAPQHGITGRTTHYVDGEIADQPASLAIGSFEKDPGFYLVYYDKGGNELTDTYHDSIGSALDQAEFEFGVQHGDWVTVFPEIPGTSDHS